MRQLALLALLLFLVPACGSEEAPPADGPGGPAVEGGPANTGIKPLDPGSAQPDVAPPPPSDPLATLKNELGRRRNSVDPEERAGAVLLLVECEDRVFAGKELEKYLHDENADVRALAAEGIGSVEYRGGVASLSNLLKSEEDAMVRNRALSSLYALSGVSAVPELIRLVADDDDASVRTSAASLLGTSGSKLGVDALIKAVNEDFSEGVRQAALVSLEKIGAPLALDAAISSLEDRNASVRVAAASLLESIGDKKAVPDLIGILEEEEEASVLHAVTSALCKLTGEKFLYVQDANAEENDARIQAWKDWWEENRED